VWWRAKRSDESSESRKGFVYLAFDGMFGVKLIFVLRGWGDGITRWDY
jgi:hypothetical protein